MTVTERSKAFELAELDRKMRLIDMESRAIARRIAELKGSTSVPPSVSLESSDHRQPSLNSASQFSEVPIRYQLSRVSDIPLEFETPGFRLVAEDRTTVERLKRRAQRKKEAVSSGQQVESELTGGENPGSGKATSLRQLRRATVSWCIYHDCTASQNRVPGHEYQPHCS